MVRSQILLDEPTADRLRRASAARGASRSEIVREALQHFFDSASPDLSWIGSLKPRRSASHEWASIQRSIAQGHRRAGKP
jgi:Arc/MetJ-type ribon-helix-helix transcriptional regulator